MEKTKERYILTIRVNELNFSDISIFQNKQLKNLVILCLRDNKIRNIDPFLNIEVPLLIELNLSVKEMADKFLPVLKKLIQIVSKAWIYLVF